MSGRTLLILMYSIYVAVGISLTAIGPIIPLLGADFGVGYSAFGPLLFVASFVYVLAVYLGGRVCQLWGTRVAILLGLWVGGFAMLSMRWAPAWGVVVALFGLYNVGFGLMDTGINTLIPQLRPDKPAAALNRLHVFAALGAVLGPLISWGGVKFSGAWSAPYTFLGVTLCTLGVVTLALRFPKGKGTSVPSPTRESRGRGILHGIAFLGIAMVLYVGSETGISTWMVTYLVDNQGASDGAAATVNSLFWLGLGFGRVLFGPHTERLGYGKSIKAFAAGASLALLPALVVRSVPVAFAAFFLTGFAFSGTFPTILALGTVVRPRDAGHVTGVLIACAGVGAMLLPAVQGYAAESFGVGAAMLLAYACTVGLFVITLAFPDPRSRGDVTVRTN